MFHRRLPRPVLATIVTIAAAAGMGLTASVSHAATVSPAQSSSADFTLYTEPDDGFSWLYDQINDAKSSIDMTMYELSDTTAEDDLVAAEARGVDVRVILDEREKSTNEAAYTYLSDNGVGVVWSSTKYYYTHEKSIVFDNTTADIMTLNLTSEYYSTSRDFAVVDTDPNDVAAIVTVFNADYAHESVTPGAGDDLVWSPTTSETDLLDLIDNAQYSLQIFSEEMDDSTIVDALCNAAEDGVSVQLVGENEDGEYDSEYSELYDCGVQISYYSSSTGFYIHGKAILADYGEPSAEIFIGSQNFSNTSLTENRELGLIINDQAIESSINTTFESDFANGTPWT
jgi:cardiolipin synthase A/B